METQLKRIMVVMLTFVGVVTSAGAGLANSGVQLLPVSAPVSGGWKTVGTLDQANVGPQDLKACDYRLVFDSGSVQSDLDFIFQQGTKTELRDAHGNLYSQTIIFPLLRLYVEMISVFGGVQEDPQAPQPMYDLYHSYLLDPVQRPYEARINLHFLPEFSSSFTYGFVDKATGQLSGLAYDLEGSRYTIQRKCR